METIDITPTWESLMPLFFRVFEDGNEEGKKAARIELLRLAKFADRINQQVKDGEKAE